MKKLLLSLLAINALPNTILASSTVVTASIADNVYTLVTTGACTGCTLTNIDFSTVKPGANITIMGNAVNLPGSFVTIKDLSGADLSGSSFSNNINLSSVKFDGATLAKVTFSGTNLTNASFQNTISLEGASFYGSLNDNAPVASNLNGVNFSGSNLSGVNLSNVQANGANFTNVPMYGANLSCSNFSNARFSGAGLSGAAISCSGSSFTNFTGALFYDPATGNGLEQSIRQQSITKNSSGNYVINISTTQLNLQGMTLTNVIFDGANMVGIDLSNATLNSVSFSPSNGIYTKLSGASFNAATFNNSSLNAADVSGGADLTNFKASPNSTFGTTNFQNSNLTNASFISCDLSNAHLGSATINGTHFDSANLSNAHLDSTTAINTSFNSANFNKASLTNFKSTACSFINANFDGANLTNAVIAGPLYQDPVTTSGNAGAIFTSTTTTTNTDLSGALNIIGFNDPNIYDLFNTKIPTLKNTPQSVGILFPPFGMGNPFTASPTSSMIVGTMNGAGSAPVVYSDIYESIMVTPAQMAALGSAVGAAVNKMYSQYNIPQVG